MTKNLSFLGKEGEEQAVIFLKSLGYKILDRNFRIRGGEIDIIAKEKSAVVFVEVKARGNMIFGQPGESINNKKLRKIIKTAEYYMLSHDLNNSIVRYDAVEVFYIDGRFEINHIKNITQ